VDAHKKGVLNIIDLGRISYREAWDLQTRIHHKLVDNKRAGYPTTQEHFFLLCEHPPVFTLGKSGSEHNLKLDQDGLNGHQIEYYKINRGGDITFHGPGQLVGYPILDLDLLFTDVHRYVRSLEEVIMRVLKLYGIESHRNDRYTGVWIQGSEALQQTRKICAIGVHLSRWVTMHGFAFNVNTNLDFFRHIVPCGIQDEDKSVCSLASLLGKDVDLQKVKQEVGKEFGVVFELNGQSYPVSRLSEITFQNFEL
jgi:lipoyl(octanoyl) transferase